MVTATRMVSLATVRSVVGSTRSDIAVSYRHGNHHRLVRLDHRGGHRYLL
jgi:hypothetical protein